MDFMDELDDVLHDFGLDFLSNSNAATENAQQSVAQPPNVRAENLPQDFQTLENLTISDVNEIINNYTQLSPETPSNAQEDANLSSASAMEPLTVIEDNAEEPVEQPQPENMPQEAQEPMVFEDAQSEEAPEEQPAEQPAEDPYLITPNSPTLLLDDSTSRFSGAEWYKEIQKARIIIGGMGGISSHLAFNLARMSPNTLVMYDDDIVETANMSGQLYSRDDVGLAKVNAIENMLRKYTTVNNIYAIQEKFTRHCEAGNIMMCGFDNMLARDIFFSKWQYHVSNLPEEERNKCLFLDGRLSLSVMQIFCITGTDEYNKRRYKEQFLFKDSEAEATVCSMKQTTYMASMIGAMMVNLFTNFVANTLDPVIPYTLPFFTEYDAQFMIFKTEN